MLIHNSENFRKEYLCSHPTPTPVATPVGFDILKLTPNTPILTSSPTDGSVTTTASTNNLVFQFATPIKYENKSAEVQITP